MELPTIEQIEKAAEAANQDQRRIMEEKHECPPGGGVCHYCWDDGASAERYRILKAVERMIDSYRCPVHQTKQHGVWIVTVPDHKLCHEGWIAPRGDIALEQLLASLTNHNSPTQ